MELQYFDQIMTFAARHEKLRKTVTGVAKQASFSAGGAVVGGVFLGPPGAMIGGVVGSAIGYVTSEPYPCIYDELRAKLNDAEKIEFAEMLMGFAGVAVVEAKEWLEKPENRTMLFGMAERTLTGINAIRQ